VESDRRRREEDELERHRIGHAQLDIGVAAGVGAVNDRGGGSGAGAGAHQPVVDRGDDGRIGGHGIVGGDARAGGHRALHVGIGEEHPADLADADDERDEDGGDERELDGADPPLIAMEHGFQHHWVLSAPEAVMRMVEK
jgi:hypothetical protein